MIQEPNENERNERTRNGIALCIGRLKEKLSLLGKLNSGSVGGQFGVVRNPGVHYVELVASQ